MISQRKWLFIVTLLFKMSPRHSAEVLSSVPECKKAVMCLIEKIRVLDQLSSGMSYSAVGYEFSVNESTIYTLNKVSLNRNTHKQGMY